MTDRSLAFCPGIGVHIAGIFWSPSGPLWKMHADPAALKESGDERLIGWAELAARHVRRPVAALLPCSFGSGLS